MIYIGADHRGFTLKEELKKYLAQLGRQFEDVGATTLMPEDDFPDYAFAVADKVAVSPDEHLGVLICGSGIGVAIAANKVRGIRAGTCWSERSALFARRHDYCNVLALPADYINGQMARDVLKAWLENKPDTQERYARRIQKITTRESNKV